MALVVERTHNTSDLHELVTLEPNLQDYARLPSPNTEPLISASSPAEPSHRLSSPIFSSFAPSLHDSEPGPGNIQSRPASLTQERGTRWPFLNISSRTSAASSRQFTHGDSGARGYNMSTSNSQVMSDQSSYPDASPAGARRPTILLSAQKDSDDVEDAHESRRRRALSRQHTSTSTRLNRLFTVPNASPTSSREPSFQKQSPASDYTRSRPGVTATLPHHLLDRGLLQGKHSDITIRAFNHNYRLHRIILDRAPFFASALSPPWCEASQREIDLRPDELDSNITQHAFELALKRLYGCALQTEEDEEAVALFATGCWLEMQDLISDSVESIMKRLGPPNLAAIIQVVTANYYGKSGERILESAKAMLCRDGADMQIKAWDGVPSDLVRDLVGSDGFFVRDEWSRWRLAKRLLDRRLKNLAREMGLWTSHSSQAPAEIRDRAVRANAEAIPHVALDNKPWRQWEALYRHPYIQPLLHLLDEDIHYVHMEFEHLQAARSERDVLGVPVLSDTTIQDALWSNLELRQKVLNATSKELSLGLMHYESPDSGDQQPALGEGTQDAVTSKLPPQPINVPGPRGLWSNAKPQRESVVTRRYNIPLADCNIVIGGDQQPTYTARAIDSNRPPQPTSHLLTQPDGTGNTQGGNSGADEAPGIITTGEAYSTYPPFRFAVELPSARMLKDRKKVFSHTVFYAGSLWNVYIKKVKSGARNPHLGVYLHRAPQQQQPPNSSAASPRPGAVDRRIGLLEQRMQLRQRRAGWLAAQCHPENDASRHTASGSSSPVRTAASTNTSNVLNSCGRGSSTQASPGENPNTDEVQPLCASRGRLPRLFGTPGSGTGYSDSSSGSEAAGDRPLSDLGSLTFQPRLHVPALSPYIDKRPTIRTYFKIYSPSRGGRMLSVYESVPCNFNFSQSWGWKSSTLMVDDEEEEEKELNMSMAETSFVHDDCMVGADMLESGAADGSGMTGSSGEGRKDTLGGKAGGFRFIVVLGVV